MRSTPLEDVLANPDDLHRRAVYADWLIERGDPRGEFIRVQLELDGASGARAVALRASAALLRQHERAWLDPFCQ